MQKKEDKTMKKLLATKATEMTVGQTLQYLALVCVMIYAPLYAVYWIYEKLSDWNFNKKLKDAENRVEVAKDEYGLKY